MFKQINIDANAVFKKVPSIGSYLNTEIISSEKSPDF